MFICFFKSLNLFLIRSFIDVTIATTTDIVLVTDVCVLIQHTVHYRAASLAVSLSLSLFRKIM
jgi:hypothetical protein